MLIFALVMASVSTLMEDINLVGEQIFDHTVLIRSQINKFLDNFERNERHKEFDGIIRASHSVCITNMPDENHSSSLFTTIKFADDNLNLIRLPFRLKTVYF